MSKPHKDLPGGSQAWADEVDALMAENRQLREVVKRLCANAGIDYSNPSRGINSGDTPSVKNPVNQKLSSLADTDTYNVADGQYLAWNQKGQKWLPITPPAAGGGGGTVDISAVSYSQLTQGYGVVSSPTRYAYTAAGTVPNGSDPYYYVENWSTGTNYMASGDWNNGPVAMVECYHDNAGRPTVDIQCEDYIRNTWSALQVLSYGIRVQSALFKPPTTTTANRPTPDGLGVVGDPGCISYDLNLRIPIWWNGTAWTDALGTVV